MTRRKSITLRLALFFAAISTVVLLAFSAMIGYLVEEHFKKLDIHDMVDKIALTRRLLSEARDESDLHEVPRRLGNALVGHSGLWVTVVGADGKPLFATTGAEFPPELLRSSTEDGPSGPIEWGGGDSHYRGIAAQIRTGIAARPPFTVAVALDMERHMEFMAAFYETFWTSLVAAILLTSVLGWFAARRGLAPVHAIARIAKGISAEQLRDRLPLDQVPTELADMAQAFNDMLARLDDSFGRLSDFSSDLAHELRTPVSNLTTQTQVALSKVRTADDYREVLYSNLEEYERLTRMISDMLFIAKADNGLIIPRREEIQLAGDIDDLIDFYRALADEKAITLSREGEGRISGDRLMLRRAVSNLMSNAMRHTPAGGKIVVSIASADPALVRLAVENTGEPIPAEHLPRLFDRFYRADASRQRNGDGTGLGLAIAKSIVDAHGGKLSVSSDAGSTRFVITFPAQ